jgi:hypothetical protein
LKRMLVPGPAIGIATHRNVIDVWRLVGKVHRLVGAGGRLAGFSGGNCRIVPGCRFRSVNRCLLMFEGSQLSIRTILRRSRAGVAGGMVTNRTGRRVRPGTLQGGIDGIILPRAEWGILRFLILCQSHRCERNHEHQEVEWFHERSALQPASGASHND